MNDIEQLKTKFYIFEKSNIYKKTKKIMIEKINNRYNSIDIDDLENKDMYEAFIDSFLDYKNLTKEDIIELISYAKAGILKLNFSHRFNEITGEKFITLNVILNQTTEYSAILFHYIISNKDFLQLQIMLLHEDINYIVVDLTRNHRTKNENSIDLKVTDIVNQIFHNEQSNIEEVWTKNFPAGFDGNMEDYLNSDDFDDED